MVNSGIKGDHYMNMKETKNDLGVLSDKDLFLKLTVGCSIFYGRFYTSIYFIILKG